MEVLLQDFTFPVPFPSLYPTEKNTLTRIHSSKTHQQKYLLAQSKMSDRQVVILLSYLLTSLSLPQPQPKSVHPYYPQIFLLTKTTQRKLQFSHVALKIKEFVSKWISKKQHTPYTNQIQIVNDVDQFINTKDTLQKKHGGNFTRRLFILTSNTYLKHRIAIKQHKYWNESCLQIDDDPYAYFHKIVKKTDFLLIQSNDFQGLLQDIFSIQISELHVKRAYSQCLKLHKYYNIRFGSKSNVKQYNEKWQKRFNKMYEQKINSFVNKSTGGYLTNTTSPSAHQQCQFLLVLQEIYYLCNYLMTELGPMNFDVCLKLKQFLSELEDTVDRDRMQGLKPGIKRQNVKKLRRVLSKFITEHPPKIRDKCLSSFYLDQLLLFYQKAVIWSQIFDSKKDDKFIVLKYVKELNPNSKSQQPKVKPTKQQQIKLTPSDHTLIHDLLSDIKTTCFLQNHLYSQQYYKDHILSLSPPNKNQLYTSPKQISKQMHTLTVGLIVNSTANDQDMQINSYRYIQNKDENIDPDQKKQAIEHYWQNIRTYGVMIFDLCDIVPDGIVVYFPNRDIMKECRAEWQEKENIYERIMNKKKIFQQSQFQQKNIQSMALFRKLCNIGRGAIFFVSAESAFSKYQTFFKHYSKCIIFVGVPYPQQVDTKLRHMGLNLRDGIKKRSFCFSRAMRIVGRCLSNCINDPQQLKLVVFADADFRNDKKISQWFSFIEEGNLNNVSILQKVHHLLRLSLVPPNAKKDTLMIVKGILNSLQNNIQVFRSRSVFQSTIQFASDEKDVINLNGLHHNKNNHSNNQNNEQNDISVSLSELISSEQINSKIDFVVGDSFAQKQELGKNLSFINTVVHKLTEINLKKPSKRLFPFIDDLETSQIIKMFFKNHHQHPEITQFVNIMIKDKILMENKIKSTLVNILQIVEQKYLNKKIKYLLINELKNKGHHHNENINISIKKIQKLHLSEMIASFQLPLLNMLLSFIITSVKQKNSSILSLSIQKLAYRLLVKGENTFKFNINIVFTKNIVKQKTQFTEEYTHELLPPLQCPFK